MITGTYHYSLLVGYWPNKVYEPHAAEVEILGESPKSYLVRFLKRHPDDTTTMSTRWVRKRKVELHGNSDTPEKEDIRLPYKD